MLIRLSRQADKQYAGLPSRLRTQVDKQLDFLSQNLRHPSIQAKKYGGTDDVWQGRVNRDYRFYFQITDDGYRIISIIPHPK
jgi:mRNA-degrading endonuclease RelE of RelBE toxin-antitoxin system